MAPQTPGVSTNASSSSTGKKKGSLGKVPQNPSIIETKRTAALNLLLGKDKEEPVPVVNQPKLVKTASSRKKHAKAEQQKKDQDENIEDDTEDEGENEHRFLIPKRGNTPSLEDVLQVKPPSVSAFTALTSTNPGPVFPLPESSQQKKVGFTKTELKPQTKGWLFGGFVHSKNG